MTSDRQPASLHTHSRWHQVFAHGIRYVLAPTILGLSGFFTANFLVSGQYSWPRTSRVLALCLTLLVLSYEFVYKEQVAATGSGEQARSAVLYACVIPYAVGAILMFVLWKL
ncbi:MAG TPA: hypothetical protein VFR79_09125 [Nitrospira sp.]|nr:hypothetical protein [Nitrospira sp.]